MRNQTGACVSRIPARNQLGDCVARIPAHNKPGAGAATVLQRSYNGQDVVYGNTTETVVLMHVTKIHNNE